MSVGVCERLEKAAAPSRNGTLHPCTKHPFTPYMDENKWPVLVLESLQHKYSQHCFRVDTEQLVKEVNKFVWRYCCHTKNFSCWKADGLKDLNLLEWKWLAWDGRELDTNTLMDKKVLNPFTGRFHSRDYTGLCGTTVIRSIENGKVARATLYGETH